MARQRRHSRPRNRRGRFSGLYKMLSVVLVAAALIIACVVFFRVNSVEVTGNTRYTAEEIIEASGIQTGDNLIVLSGSRVSAAIRARLPYVEGVSIRKALPDCVAIKVTERVAAASVESAEGRWLISAQGKLLEQDNGAVKTIQITGLRAVGPYVGGMLQAEEEQQLTVDYVKGLLAALERYDMLAQCTALDCTATSSMTLEYGIYRIKLPRGGDYDYYIELTRSALDSGRLQEGQSGLLDLTIMEGKVRFRPDH